MRKDLPILLVLVATVAAAFGATMMRSPGNTQEAASLRVGLISSALAQVDVLHEGDLISAAGSSDPDIYIINEHGFKRLFLNPVIFGFYGHLGGFANVKTVTPAVRDSYGTSGLFRNCETNDERVYGVEVTGEDTGILHWVNVTGAQAVAQDANFFKKVFCINSNEFSWYAMGSTYTSVTQVPDYARSPSPTPTPSVSVSPTPTPSPTPGIGSQPDAYTPVARIVGDQQSVIAARFQFTAAIDNFRISRINIEIPDASGIVEVRLWHEGTLLGSVPAQTDMTFYINQFNLVLVQAGQSETLDVEIVLGDVAVPGGGATGADHTVTLDKSESRAIAQSSGTEGPIGGDDLVGEKLYAYKAVPFVTRLALPATTLVAGGATNTIARFNIGSGGTDPVGWNRARFTYGLGNSITGLHNIRLFEANSGTEIAGSVATTSTNFTITTTNEQPAGDYMIKAVVNGATTGDDHVVVSWQHSGLTYATPTAAASVDASAALVWTDLAVLPHTLLTADWNNDYLVKYFDLDSWSLTD